MRLAYNFRERQRLPHVSMFAGGGVPLCTLSRELSLAARRESTTKFTRASRLDSWPCP